MQMGFVRPLSDQDYSSRLLPPCRLEAVEVNACSDRPTRIIGPVPGRVVVARSLEHLVHEGPGYVAGDVVDANAHECLLRKSVLDARRVPEWIGNTHRERPLCGKVDIVFHSDIDAGGIRIAQDIHVPISRRALRLLDVLAASVRVTARPERLRTRIRVAQDIHAPVSRWALRLLDVLAAPVRVAARPLLRSSDAQDRLIRV